LTAGAGQAAANEYRVTNTDADGEGSWTAAIKQAREHEGGDQISFKKSLRGEIELGEQVTVKGRLVIKGNGYGEPGDRKFHRVELVGRRGDSAIVAGKEADLALRSLYLDGVRLQAGHVRNLTVKDSFLRGDRTVDTTGIYGGGESLRVLKTTVTGYDQGLRLFSDDSRVDRSTISDNVGGGGIAVDGGELNLTNSTVAGNVVSGDGAPVGGGISAGRYGGTARVVNSTIANNRAVGPDSVGGGLFGNVDVNNSTISGNSSASGAGVAGSGDADADVSNSIIYGNLALDGIPADCGVPFTSGGGNVIGGPRECLLDAGDRVGVDPLLGPLADNGGPTETMAIGAGSPAIGLAVKETATDFDQRGVKRGNDPDAGAFELEG
jgi:hypothetical protein